MKNRKFRVRTLTYFSGKEEYVLKQLKQTVTRNSLGMVKTVEQYEPVGVKSFSTVVEAKQYVSENFDHVTNKEFVEF